MLLKFIIGVVNNGMSIIGSDQAVQGLVKGAIVFAAVAIDYLRSAGNHKPSMLLDMENNRKTEIDFLNGKFIEFGSQADIDTPYNSTMRALVKGLESKQK